MILKKTKWVRRLGQNLEKSISLKVRWLCDYAAIGHCGFPLYARKIMGLGIARQNP
jgi:hypothetical protein